MSIARSSYLKNTSGGSFVDQRQGGTVLGQDLSLKDSAVSQDTNLKQNSTTTKIVSGGEFGRMRSGKYVIKGATTEIAALESFILSFLGTFASIFKNLYSRDTVAVVVVPSAPPPVCRFTIQVDDPAGSAVGESWQQYIYCGAIRQFPNSTNATDDDFDFVIDWGDGSEPRTIKSIADFDDFQGNGVPDRLLVPYTQGGTYNVTFTGKCDKMSLALVKNPSYAPRGALASVEEWGGMKIDTYFYSGLYGSNFSYTFSTSLADPQNHLTTLPEDAPIIDTPILANLFGGFRVFNSPINNWDVSNATDMRFMFADAPVFNQPLDNWNTSNVTSMYAMFYSQDRDFNRPNWQFAFDQDISSWDFTGLDSNQGLLYFGFGLNLSSSNYDALLISWQNQAANMPSGMTDVDMGGSRYTAAAASARSALVNTYGWTITDGGQI